MLLSHPPGEASAAVWIDLLAPTAEESAAVRQATGLRVPTEDQISEIESTSRLAFEGGAYYVSAPLVAKGAEGEHLLTPIGFVYSSRVLLTVRFGALPSIDAAHEQARAQPPKNAEEALLRIFELVVDRAADGLEHAGAECDDLSRAAFRAGRPRVEVAAKAAAQGTAKTAAQGTAKAANRLAAALRRIGGVAERVSRIRDELLGLGRIGAYIMESGLEGAPPVSATRLKAVRADVASLTDYEAHLSGKVQFLLDATLGFINIEQNEIVKTLTIASVVGIPPVLVAGIYGMNFRVMPELTWTFGYPFAVGLILLSALVPLLWFKLRRWM